MSRMCLFFSVWRAILDGREIMKQGIIRRIGNGENTNIWSDNWIPRKEMLRPYGSCQNNPPALVSDLIDHTAAVWDMQRLQEVCLPIDIPAILTIPLCTTNIHDTWSWFFEKNGCSSVRSAYRMMVDRNPEGKLGLMGRLVHQAMSEMRTHGKCYGKIQFQGRYGCSFGDFC